MAGGGKGEKKGADTSTQAAGAPCIQMQVAAGSLLRLITEKHIRGHWVRVRDNRAAALSFERGCSAERTASSCHLGAGAVEPIPIFRNADLLGQVT